MPVKLIIFDLDGVLCDTRPLHFHALNAALTKIDPKYVITSEEHESRYDGLPTSTKLKMLEMEKGLHARFHQKVWLQKQIETIRLIDELMVPNPELIHLLLHLRSLNYRLYVASNSVRVTVNAMLAALRIDSFFEKTFSNNEVLHCKPHPEIYLRCVLDSGLSPREVMICEDSPVGRRAAVESGCHLCPIETPDTVTWSHLSKYLQFYDQHGRLPEHQIPWIDPHMNVVIPMAGAGSRFRKAGYANIKPLIDVKGRPMIQRVVQNLNLMSHHILICQQAHIQEYHLDSVLPWLMQPGQTCEIKAVDGLSEGAACTILSVADLIDNDAPLIIANSDQFVEGSMTAFMYKMQSEAVDGGLLVFRGTEDPKWSYAKLNAEGWVSDIQEKKVISEWATVGIYYWKRGSDFVRYTRQMIEKNIRVNNEFYVAPVYNEAIADGKKIAVFECNKMWGLGTPEDLEIFLSGNVLLT